MLLSSSESYWETNKSAPARTSNNKTTTTASTNNIWQLLSFVNTITIFEAKRYIPYQYCNGLAIQFCKDCYEDEVEEKFVPEPSMLNAKCTSYLTKQAFEIKYNSHFPAGVAELADALRSGRSELTLMRVQIPPSAQETRASGSLFILLLYKPSFLPQRARHLSSHSLRSPAPLAGGAREKTPHHRDHGVHRDF